MNPNVEGGWAVINGLNLNTNDDFCLVNKKYERVNSIKRAAGIYSRILGEAVCPMTDSLWIVDLQDCFRVSGQWKSEDDSWEARLPNVDVVGTGKTFGEAQVNVLLLSLEKGTVPVRYTRGML